MEFTVTSQSCVETHDDAFNHFTDQLHDEWVIFKFAYDTVNTFPTDKNWSLVKLRFPIMDQDSDRHVHALNQKIGQYDLYILLDTCTDSQEPLICLQKPADDEYQIICDLRGISQLKTPVPAECDEYFMLEFPHSTGILQTVWVPDYDYPRASWTKGSNDHLIITGAAETISVHTKHKPQT